MRLGAGRARQATRPGRCSRSEAFTPRRAPDGSYAQSRVVATTIVTAKGAENGLMTDSKRIVVVDSNLIVNGPWGLASAAWRVLLYQLARWSSHVDRAGPGDS